MVKTREEFTTQRKRQNKLERQNRAIGFVTQVFEHDGTESIISNHEANVQLQGQNKELKRIPIHTDDIGTVYVPEVGDPVEVGFLNSKSERGYIAGRVYTEQYRAPLARKGQFRREFEQDNGDNLYIEAERRDHQSGTPDTVRMATKEDGLSDPSSRIEIDSSGSEPVLRMSDGAVEQDGDTLRLELDTNDGSFVLSDDSKYGIEADGNGVVTIKTTDENSSQSMGLQIDFNTGEFKIGDSSGYGIESDGSGNFTWYNKSIDFVDDGSTISW